MDQFSPSDAELSARVRAGDRDAFAVLWQRHGESAFVVARQYRGIADPQDIVQEASRRVLNAIVRGGGPFGDFRPYMNQTVRNVAVSWSREHSPDPVADMADYADHADGSGGDYADGTLERMITVRAFKSLPKRWQTVLWYTYVEGMGSDEAADHLGLSRNAAASLIGRAREGLRQAWLKAHVADDALPVECRWVVDMLPSFKRDDITDRHRCRVERHLDECARCAIIAAEINDLAAQLPILLLPLVVAGFDVLGADVEELLAYDPYGSSALGQPPASGTPSAPDGSSASGSSSAPSAPLPRTGVSRLSAIRHGVTPGKIWLASGVLAGGVAVAVIAANLAPAPATGRPQSDLAGVAASSPQASSDPAALENEAEPKAPERDDSASPSPSPSATPPPPANPTNPRRQNQSVPPQPGGSAPDAEAQAVPGGESPLAVPELANTPTAGHVEWMGAGFTFSGRGEPGATIELLDGGTVFATATVAADGTWSVAPEASVSAARPSMTVTARQVAGDGRRSEATAARVFTFTLPEWGGVSTVGGTPSVTVEGTVGRSVEAWVDGVQLPTQTIGTGGSTVFTVAGLAPGRHSFTARITNGVQVGASITFTFSAA